MFVGSGNALLPSTGVVPGVGVRSSNPVVSNGAGGGVSMPPGTRVTGSGFTGGNRLDRSAGGCVVGGKGLEVGFPGIGLTGGTGGVTGVPVTGVTGTEVVGIGSTGVGVTGVGVTGVGVTGVGVTGVGVTGVGVTGVGVTGVGVTGVGVTGVGVTGVGVTDVVVPGNGGAGLVLFPVGLSGGAGLLLLPPGFNGGALLLPGLVLVATCVLPPRPFATIADAAITPGSPAS